MVVHANIYGRSRLFFQKNFIINLSRLTKKNKISFFYLLEYDLTKFVLEMFVHYWMPLQNSFCFFNYYFGRIISFQLMIISDGMFFCRTCDTIVNDKACDSFIFIFRFIDNSRSLVGMVRATASIRIVAVLSKKKKLLVIFPSIFFLLFFFSRSVTRSECHYQFSFSFACMPLVVDINCCCYQFYVFFFFFFFFFSKLNKTMNVRLKNAQEDVRDEHNRIGIIILHITKIKPFFCLNR